MIVINTYEKKFLDILKGESSIAEFENWLYKNEEELTKKLPSEIYNDLILVNYKTKESKHDLAKALNIDFEKLELYEVQCLLKNEIGNKPNLNNVNYEIDLYELDFISFDFEIGTLKFRMHNPFEIKNFTELTNEERKRIFAEKFGSAKRFLESLLDSIETNNFRVHNWKKHEQTDSMTEAKLTQTKKDEYKLIINGHFCHIKKEYIANKMKEAWL